MKGLAETLERLRTGADRQRAAAGSRLTRLEGFGSNPGNLAAHVRVPAMSSGMPLVVVLHGCTQDAASYDAGTGWSRLADQYGFAALFPEQKRENNPNLCFNWFEPGDTSRDRGEVASIVQMVDAVIHWHGLAHNRIYVTGLSAGGAMATALLATYPDRFSGGAIIAGLPFAGAADVTQAFERMQARRFDQPGSLEALVRQASVHPGPWPSLSLWQGSADHVVNPKNLDAILEQWLGLHGLSTEPTRQETVNGYPRRTWADATGRDVIEAYSITGMGHGTPIGRPGKHEYGAPAAHILQTEISSTLAVASFWGLIDPAKAQGHSSTSQVREEIFLPSDMIAPSPQVGSTDLDSNRPTSGIQATIEKALRAAGLMK